MNKAIILSISLFLMGNTETTSKMDKQASVLECVIFQVNDTVTEEEALTKLSRLTPLVKEYDGFISRSISVNDKGEFMDLIYWTDIESAKYATKKIMENPIALEAFSTIDESTMQMRHFEIKKNFNLK